MKQRSLETESNKKNRLKQYLRLSTRHLLLLLTHAAILMMHISSVIDTKVNLAMVWIILAIVSDYVTSLFVHLM